MPRAHLVTCKAWRGSASKSKEPRSVPWHLSWKFSEHCFLTDFSLPQPSSFQVHFSAEIFIGFSLASNWELGEL